MVHGVVCPLWGGGGSYVVLVGGMGQSGGG